MRVLSGVADGGADPESRTTVPCVWIPGSREEARPGMTKSAAQAWIGPAFDLGGADDLLGLVRVERAGRGRPAFRQNLHGKQFGVYFGFERARRAHRAGGAVVGLHGLVRTKDYIPGIGLRHAAITPIDAESFATRKQAAPEGGLLSSKRLVAITRRFRQCDGCAARPAP